MMEEKKFITLGQLLKVENIIDSGGHAKWFLSENVVYVNGELENRRGRKLYDGDKVSIEGIGDFTLNL